MTLSGLIVLAVFVFRLVFLKISIKNEKAILANGGQEFGVQNTKYITILHILFYLSCFVEATIRQVHFDALSSVGLGLLVFSMFMLYVVTQLLGDIWTVKLMLVKNHKFVDHWLFRYVKHPNYFLNIIPELIGLALLCHALLSFCVLFPFMLLFYIIVSRKKRNFFKKSLFQMGLHRSELFQI